jgi:hypothetical protein
MPTNKRAETRSISIAAPSSTVYEYLADASKVPAWAPAFAPRIRPHGADWIVTAPDREFTVSVLARQSAGTVDIVSAEDHTRGLFARVLPNGQGSELLFTLFFPQDASEEAIKTQIATLNTELSVVRETCEQPRR